MSQGLLVLILFSAALFYLARKFYLEYLGKGGSCDHCALKELDKPINPHKS